jgi:hypothetical protein
MYHSYTEEQRAETGRCMAQHGPTTSASCYFISHLKHPVPESTVNKFQDQYQKEMELNRKCCTDAVLEVTVLPPKRGGAHC